jgi:hypothetical protein
MFYANKKTTVAANQAQQSAKILANVKSLLEKKLITINDKAIFLYPQLWKDAPSAINWMKCLQIYCILKRQIKESDTLNFYDITSQQAIGIIANKKAKLIDFEFKHQE